MSFLTELRLQDPSSDVAFHLEGLLEASDKLRSHVARLDSIYPADEEAAAGAMVELQVELYTHFFYHLKKLRLPLKRLIDAAYEKLPDIDPDAEVDFSSP